MCCKQTREAHKWWNSSSKQSPTSINLSAATFCLNLRSPESRHFCKAAIMADSATTPWRLVEVSFFCGLEDSCSSRLISKHWVLEQLESLEMLWGSKCRQRSQRKLRMEASFSFLCIADSQYRRHIGRISYIPNKEIGLLFPWHQRTFSYHQSNLASSPPETEDTLLLLRERTLAQAPPPPPSHTHPPPPSQGGAGSLEWLGSPAPRRLQGVLPLTPHHEGGQTQRECPAEPVRQTHKESYRRQPSNVVDITNYSLGCFVNRIWLASKLHDQC